MNSDTFRNAGAPVDERVADLLGRMTLEEKVAQLGAIWVTQLVNDDEFDDAATRALLDRRHRPDHPDRRIHRTAPARTRRRLINDIQRVAVEHTRLGIPVLLHEEGVGGFTAPRRHHLPAGARSRVHVGSRARRRGRRRHSPPDARGRPRLVLSPVLDVARDPRWGRVEETYGESPELGARLGVAYVRGLQTYDLSQGVACVAKHFLGYASSMGGRNQAPVHLGERELRRRVRDAVRSRHPRRRRSTRS